MKVDFSNYKKGDKVWHVIKGWGTITDINNSEYPIITRFGSFTIDGKEFATALYPTIYPNEFKIPDEAFKKPLPNLKMDTKVLVWGDELPPIKYKRYFKNFTPDGEIECWSRGSTSWSTDSEHNYTIWDNYEVVED